jgi:glucose-6-phosphate 1-dehydrogenase
VAEKVGVGKRGGYYEGAGALRDMVQNHLLQVMCLVAMEPPTSFQADEVRNKRVDVLNAIRPIGKDEVEKFAVRGQYSKGVVDGLPVPAYREEENVAAGSGRETFVAMKLFIDNWRWQGVPFYLRTGKHLPGRVSEISLQFRPVPHHPFSDKVMQSNRLAIQIEPKEGIMLRTQAKEPGPGMKIKPVEMHYTYQEVFQSSSPEAYETLLLDVVRGDPGLFMRNDQVETAWSVLESVLEHWEETSPADFPNYAPGEWGPKSAEELITQDGRTWLVPACLEFDRKEVRKT